MRWRPLDPQRRSTRFRDRVAGQPQPDQSRHVGDGVAQQVKPPQPAEFRHQADVGDPLAGLFTDQTTATRVQHPSEDATAALLKAASTIRVYIPGIEELIVTGPQLRKLDKKLAEEHEK